MQKSKWTLASATVIVVAAAPVALADTLKVPQQFDTIQEAVNAASPGDTIVVSRVTRAENVVANVDGLRFIGKKAVWDGNVAGVNGICLQATGTGIVVQGFTFRHGDLQVSIQGDGALVTKCTFVNANDTAVHVMGHGARVTKSRLFGFRSDAVEVDGDDALVEKNRIENGDSGAIDIEGARALVQRNFVRTIEDDGGIYVAGDDATVGRNTVFSCDGQGVEVSGDRATVTRNRVGDLYDDGVYVSGDDALIERNTIEHSDDYGIELSGSDGRIVANSIQHAYGYGIRASGDRCLIQGNTTMITGDAGIDVSGDDYHVIGNTISRTYDDAYGISTNGNSNGPTGALIEGNRVSDVPDWGIYVRGIDVRILRNRVDRAGAEGEGGFSIRGGGSGMLIEGNTALDCDGDGFRTYGSNMQLRDNLARGCTDDGFAILDDYTYGNEGNTLVDCVALNCYGEGIENRGVDTTVQSCRFLGNRLDVTCDITHGATFATFSGNDYVTGGADAEPEIEN